MGFYFTSEAFDEREPVLVAAVDIAEGDTVSASSLTSSLAVMGSIPHVPWSPEVLLAFDGLIAAQPIPAGALVRGDMFLTLGDSGPGPGELEVVLSLDASLVPSGVAEGNLVLLIDPGVDPGRDDLGRPRSVLHALRLDNYSNGQLRMFVPPEEWVYWWGLRDQLGASPMVLRVSDTSDVSDIARRLNAEWRLLWESAVADALATAEQS